MAVSYLFLNLHAYIGDPIDFLSRPKFKVDLEAIDLDYGPVHSNKKKIQKKVCVYKTMTISS